MDVVEGLDVDKDNFDKYSVRRNLAFLLNDLWELDSFRDSFRATARSHSQNFTKFIGTVVNDSIHLLEDSLGRLIDIRQLQLAMQDTQEWSKQDPEILRERQRYPLLVLRHS